MSEEVKYKVSYLASVPDDLRAGDDVEIIDTKSVCEELIGKTGVIVKVYPYQSLLINLDFDKRNYVISSKLVRKVDMKHENNNLAFSPAEYIRANNLGFYEGSIVSLITSYCKNGSKKNLEEIKHYCDLIIEKENPE